MRIEFDKGFIEIDAVDQQVAIIIGAKDKNNPLKTNINSCLLSPQDFSNALALLNIDFPPPNITVNK